MKTGTTFFFTAKSDVMDDGSSKAISIGDILVCLETPFESIDLGCTCVIQTNDGSKLAAVTEKRSGAIRLHQLNPGFDWWMRKTDIKNIYPIIEVRRRRY